MLLLRSPRTALVPLLRTMSSSSTTAPFTYINADELATLLRSPDSRDKVAVVDVRDDDFIGGSIAPALHYPSGQFESSLPKLLADETIRSKDQVVFHCMLSQQRGPSCAKMYAYAKRAAHQQQKGEGEAEQKVLVLRDGWKGFSSKFKADPSLVKDYNQDQQWES